MNKYYYLNTLKDCFLGNDKIDTAKLHRFLKKIVGSEAFVDANNNDRDEQIFLLNERIDKLEDVNASLIKRISKLENSCK